MKSGLNINLYITVIVKRNGGDDVGGYFYNITNMVNIIIVKNVIHKYQSNIYE